MSKQWGHGFNTGMAEGHDLGEGAGRGLAEWKIANEMRVLFCALITAHKRHDGLAFYATIEIVKTVLSKYANFDEEDWAVFRRDVARKEETPNTEFAKMRGLSLADAKVTDWQDMTRGNDAA